MPLKKSASHYKQKPETFSVTRSLTSEKFYTIFLACTRGQKRRKSEFVTKFVGSMYLQLFPYKMSLKQPVQSLLQCFFTKHLKQKPETEFILAK